MKTVFVDRARSSQCPISTLYLRYDEKCKNWFAMLELLIPKIETFRIAKGHHEKNETKIILELPLQYLQKEFEM